MRLLDGSKQAYYDEELRYDDNGNISSLKRSRHVNTSSTDVADNLTYSYSNGEKSNRLLKVVDTGLSNVSYADANTTGDDFAYDANGNLTIDKDKGIANISYNVLNLVRQVNGVTDGTSKAKGVVQNYVWDATGAKLSYISTGTGTVKKTYVGSVEYTTNENGDLVPNRIFTDEGHVMKREGWTENSSKSKYVYYYTVKDHLGNIRIVIDDEQEAQVWQNNSYSAFGLLVSGTVAGISTESSAKANDRYYNGKEAQDVVGWYDFGARMYNPEIGRWMNVDPSHEDGGQESFTPYGYVFNNPIKLTDPDGRCPNCGTAGIGAVVGGLIGGGVELGRQLWNDGKVTSWSAVGGSALQGAVTGAAAGFTGGASLFATGVVSGGANAVGGTLNRTVQGQSTTLKDVVVDGTVGAVLGAGGKLVGNAVRDATNNLSNSAKGKLGEAITEIKYGAQGYKSAGNDVVKTGAKTATGRQAEARFDHKMTNVLTGKQITVESKFNTSGLTRNQSAVVKGGYNVVIDRTTSQGLGNATQAATVGTGAGLDAQRNKK